MRWHLIFITLGIAKWGCQAETPTTARVTSQGHQGETGEGQTEEQGGEAIRQNIGFATIRVQRLGSLHGSHDKFFAVSALPVLEISRYVVTLKALLESAKHYYTPAYVSGNPYRSGQNHLHKYKYFDDNGSVRTAHAFDDSTPEKESETAHAKELFRGEKTKSFTSLLDEKIEESNWYWEELLSAHSLFSQAHLEHEDTKILKTFMETSHIHSKKHFGDKLSDISTVPWTAEPNRDTFEMELTHQYAEVVLSMTKYNFNETATLFHDHFSKEAAERTPEKTFIAPFQSQKAFLLPKSCTAGKAKYIKNCFPPHKNRKVFADPPSREINKRSFLFEYQAQRKNQSVNYLFEARRFFVKRQIFVALGFLVSAIAGACYASYKFNSVSKLTKTLGSADAKLQALHHQFEISNKNFQIIQEKLSHIFVAVSHAAKYITALNRDVLFIVLIERSNIAARLIQKLINDLQMSFLAIREEKFPVALMGSEHLKATFADMEVKVKEKGLQFFSKNINHLYSVDCTSFYYDLVPFVLCPIPLKSSLEKPYDAFLIPQQQFYLHGIIYELNLREKVVFTNGAELVKIHSEADFNRHCRIFEDDEKTKFISCRNQRFNIYSTFPTNSTDFSCQEKILKEQLDKLTPTCPLKMSYRPEIIQDKFFGKYSLYPLYRGSLSIFCSTRDGQGDRNVQFEALEPVDFELNQGCYAKTRHSTLFRGDSLAAYSEADTLNVGLQPEHLLTDALLDYVKARKNIESSHGVWDELLEAEGLPSLATGKAYIGDLNSKWQAKTHVEQTAFNVIYIITSLILFSISFVLCIYYRHAWVRWLRRCRRPTCCQREEVEEAPEEPEVPRHKRYREERRRQGQTPSKTVTFDHTTEVTEPSDSSQLPTVDPNFGSTESEIGRTFLRTINRGDLPPDNPLRVAARRHIFRPRK